MLWRILQAHGGRLPDDVAVCFANTGREMPATLDFVRDCGAAWGVDIVWLEYRWEPGRHFYERVNHNSASRDGTPYEVMLKSRSMLPTPVRRFCTEELKIKTMARYAKRELGWKKWGNIVGLRADEPGRVGKATDPDRVKENGLPVHCPLSEAGIREPDVLAFWAAQPFDLRLRGKWEGNCDGCFLKGRGAISRVMRDHPERMAWWAKMEASMAGSTLKPGMNLFRADREPFARLAEIVRDQGVLPFNVFDDQMECQWSCTD